MELHRFYTGVFGSIDKYFNREKDLKKRVVLSPYQKTIIAFRFCRKMGTKVDTTESFIRKARLLNLSTVLGVEPSTIITDLNLKVLGSKTFVSSKIVTTMKRCATEDIGGWGRQAVNTAMRRKVEQAILAAYEVIHELNPSLSLIDKILFALGFVGELGGLIFTDKRPALTEDIYFTFSEAKKHLPGFKEYDFFKALGFKQIKADRYNISYQAMAGVAACLCYYATVEK